MFTSLSDNTNLSFGVVDNVRVEVPVAAPSITAQPQNQTALQGSNATFTVAASGTPAPGYQWRFNGTNLTDASASAYTVTNAQPASAGSYTVVVTNSAGSVTSAVAILTVNVPPWILTQPQSQTVTQGVNVIICVAAMGTAPLSYQWRFNGTNIAGATTNCYSRNNVQTNDAGTYSVVVTNVAGSLTNSTVLTVLAPPFIIGQPQGQTVRVGTNATFAVSATGTEPLNYQWRFNTRAIPEATQSSYTVVGVQLTNAGEYAVTVTNEDGVVQSSTAALTVLPLVLIEFTNIAMLGDRHVRLAGRGDVGTYLIEFAANLTNWQELISVPCTNGAFEYIDETNNAAERFYRAKLPP
jgi:hypothetical protein